MRLIPFFIPALKTKAKVKEKMKEKRIMSIFISTNKSNTHQHKSMNYFGLEIACLLARHLFLFQTLVIMHAWLSRHLLAVVICNVVILNVVILIKVFNKLFFCSFDS